ncbi:hypothetical protein ACS0TY_028091 [Phlomoides rotata]
MVPHDRDKSAPPKGPNLLKAYSWIFTAAVYEAYAHKPYIGCILWSDTLIDVQNFNDVGVDLYIRLAASEFDNSKEKKLLIIIPVLLEFYSFVVQLVEVVEFF